MSADIVVAVCARLRAARLSRGIGRNAAERDGGSSALRRLESGRAARVRVRDVLALSRFYKVDAADVIDGWAGWNSSSPPAVVEGLPEVQPHLDEIRRAMRRARSSAGLGTPAAARAALDNASHSSTVQRWESGAYALDLAGFVALCGVYGVTPGALVRDAGHRLMAKSGAPAQAAG